ncbi:hypothetical protein [Enterococcus sp. CSURQ0835]|uniref:hypothetical protein n=1 Tax=Enterococcus sp. CSURQ0835 TaxID=2681394 RepID=UPI00135CBF00|nr:hypothetical protein [Enterococcus sp. CSURQ0835]
MTTEKIKRTSKSIALFSLGAAATGHMPNWLLAALATITFGLAMAYDFADWDEKVAERR